MVEPDSIEESPSVFQTDVQQPPIRRFHFVAYYAVNCDIIIGTDHTSRTHISPGWSRLTTPMGVRVLRRADYSKVTPYGAYHLAGVAETLSVYSPLVGVESIELPIWGFTDPSSPKNYSRRGWCRARTYTPCLATYGFQDRPT